MKLFSVKTAFIIIFFFCMQISVFSNEKNGETEIKENRTGIKLNFNVAADLNEEKTDDIIIKMNMKKANGYRIMGIFGILITLIVAPGAGAGIILAFGTPSGSGFGLFFSTLALIGGIFLAMLAIIVLAAAGIIMAIAGYTMYNKFKKSKQPDPFLDFNNDKKEVSMGLKIRI